MVRLRLLVLKSMTLYRLTKSGDKLHLIGMCNMECLNQHPIVDDIFVLQPKRLLGIYSQNNLKLLQVNLKMLYSHNQITAIQILILMLRKDVLWFLSVNFIPLSDFLQKGEFGAVVLWPQL